MGKNLLKEYYEYYTTHISKENMAISLNLANYMYELCLKNKFKILMDRGSGFSSFVLRFYAKEHSDVVVFSIDSIPEWLEKTKNYLKMNELSTENLYLWKDFYAEYKDKIIFDFILEDAKKDVRKTTNNEMMSFIKKNGGMILWDDYQKPYNKIIVDNLREKKDIEVVGIKKETLDSYRRFSALTIHGR